MSRTHRSHACYIDKKDYLIIFFLNFPLTRFLFLTLIKVISLARDYRLYLIIKLLMFNAGK